MGASEQDSIMSNDHVEVVLAIHMTDKGALGSAYYVVYQQALFVMNDLEGADVSILEPLLIHIQPTIVLLPFRAQDRVVDFFDKYATWAARGEKISSGSDIAPVEVTKLQVQNTAPSFFVHFRLQNTDTMPH